MKIYKLARTQKTQETEYDHILSCVVVAESAGAARALVQTAADENGEEDKAWTKSALTTCRQVGTAKFGRSPQILCTDIHEG
jgi:hypothetical protein